MNHAAVCVNCCACSHKHVRTGHTDISGITFVTGFLSHSNLAPLFISCNTHPASPPQLSVAIAGTESYISSVLQPYVEQFSSKPSDWQTFLRFLLIPLGKFAARQGGMTAHFRSSYMTYFIYNTHTGCSVNHQASWNLFIL